MYMDLIDRLNADSESFEEFEELFGVEESEQIGDLLIAGLDNLFEAEEPFDDSEELAMLFWVDVLV
jgi:hypothetical protein